MKNLIQHIAIVIFLFGNLNNLFSQKINPNGKNIFYYSTGEISAEGNLKNGKPEGYWKNYYQNGELKSEGNRKNHLLDSVWKFYSNGFLKELVTYKNNKKNGYLKKYLDSNIIYSLSNYKEDTLQGKYEIYYPTGERKFLYTNVNGNFHGEAYQYRKDSTIITTYFYNKGKLIKRQKINRFNSKNEKEGVWKFYDEDGNIKESGKYKNGKKNGLFSIYLPDGQVNEIVKYDMDILQNNPEEVMFQDLEKIYYPTGEIHFTIAKNANKKREGITQEYDKKGKKIIASVYKNDTLFAKGKINKRGLKYGTWRYYYKGEKVIAKGKFRSDLKTKKWNYYFINGQLAQTGNYIKGKQTGKWVWYYKKDSANNDNFTTSKLKQIHRKENYLKGKEDGEVIEYGTEGEILTKGFYINGLRDGEWFYEVGDHVEKGNYVDGERNGTWNYFYDNGKIGFKGNYVNGLEDGKHQYFYDNGKPSWNGKYNLGKKEGNWKRFDSTGILLVTYLFKSGFLIKTDGKKITPDYEFELK